MMPELVGASREDAEIWAERTGVRVEFEPEQALNDADLPSGVSGVVVRQSAIAGNLEPIDIPVTLYLSDAVQTPAPWVDPTHRLAPKPDDSP
jgi:hypothetical protein